VIVLVFLAGKFADTRTLKNHDHREI